MEEVLTSHIKAFSIPLPRLSGPENQADKLFPPHDRGGIARSQNNNQYSRNSYPISLNENKDILPYNVWYDCYVANSGTTIFVRLFTAAWLVKILINFLLHQNISILTAYIFRDTLLTPHYYYSQSQMAPVALKVTTYKTADTMYHNIMMFTKIIGISLLSIL